MTTFSQIVDEVGQETRRAGMAPEISSYVNQVVRELHSDAQSDGMLLFAANLREALVTPDVDEGYVWTIPDAHLYQNMDAVYYTGPGEYAEETNPRRVHNRFGENASDYYYYRTGDSVAFGGYGGTGADIQIAWYAYPRGLVYYAPGDAPARWDYESQSFVYHTNYTSNQEAARELVTHWVLQRHGDLVRQGVRAKIYARLADEVRARSAYAMYMKLRTAMAVAESGDRSVRYG